MRLARRRRDGIRLRQFPACLSQALPYLVVGLLSGGGLLNEGEFVHAAALPAGFQRCAGVAELSVTVLGGAHAEPGTAMCVDGIPRGLLHDVEQATDAAHGFDGPVHEAGAPV